MAYSQRGMVVSEASADGLADPSLLHATHLLSAACDGRPPVDCFVSLHINSNLLYIYMSRTRDVAVLYVAVLCSCKRSDGMAYSQRGMVVSERSAKRRADIGRRLRFQLRYHAPRPLYESTVSHSASSFRVLRIAGR